MDLLYTAEVFVNIEKKQQERLFLENWNISLPISYLNISSIFEISKAWKSGVTEISRLQLEVMRIALFWKQDFRCID